MTDFLTRLDESPLIFEGAMGTLLYERGVFLNACYDAQSLHQPDLVRSIHEDYVKAGAQVLITNSFGANRLKLTPHGLAHDLVAINQAAVQVARDAGGDDCYVVASIGPCLKPGQIIRPENRERVASAFAEQIAALAEAKPDALLFETFSHLDELQVALPFAAETGLPVIASFALTDDLKTTVGTELDTIVRRINADERVHVLGLNCGQGPAGLLGAVEHIADTCRKPVVLRPNAGFPREVEGRMLYLTSPDYFTEYCKRAIELGVRGVGGCCGTTPDHISTMSQAVSGLSGVKRHVEITDYAAEADEEVVAKPVAERCRLAAKLVAGEKVTSVELLPPRSCDLEPMIRKVQAAADAGVDAINIPDGPRASARISTMIAALEIVRRVPEVEPILHYCCRDRNLIGMQGDLMGGFAAGLVNYLALTGDPPKLGDYPHVTGVFDVDAIGLTQMITNLNHGFDIGGNAIKTPTAIFNGVAGNPCAVDFQREVDRYYAKLDAGAEYGVTQPIFDVEALFRFLDAVDKHERKIPLIAGVWPLSSYKNAEFMANEVPGVVVPDAILERMAACEDKDTARQTGIDIAKETVQAIHDRVQGFQVSAPLGRLETALAVLEDVLPRKAKA